LRAKNLSLSSYLRQPAAGNIAFAATGGNLIALFDRPSPGVAGIARGKLLDFRL
jgi:hypothetical protein